MPQSYFASPRIATLTLADGRTITVRRRLSHGERDDLAAVSRLQNWKHVRTAKVAAYLVGWTLTDDDGRAVPMSAQLPENERIDTIRNLDPDAFDEIYEALEAHEKAVQAEVDALKNGKDGAAPSSATSPSA